jgi:DNA polymerase III sliding clamp (beta) subunit (PCNA family)
MNISKLELQKALEIVKPGLANRDIIEQATSFAFINGRVVTFNDEISISHPIKNLDIQGAVEASKLYKFLSKIKQDEIELEVNESGILLKVGRAKVWLVLHSEIKLPLDSIQRKGEWKKLPDTFIKAVGFVMTSAGRDMSKPVLTCVHVNKVGFTEASDGHKITKYEIGEEMPVDTFLIPAQSITTVVKMKPIYIAEGSGWIHFKSETDTILSCRLFEKDTYPDIKSKGIYDVQGVELVFPKACVEIIERASIFAKKDHILDEEIEVNIENKKLKVRSISDSAWFEEYTAIRYNKDPITILIHPNLLLDALKETYECTLSEQVDKIMFKGKNWIYVAALRARA